MRTGTVGMGSVFGVPIRLHFTFILLLVMLAAFGFNGTETGVMHALYIAVLFLSVLLHEIGHAVVSKRFGIRTVEIVVFPIGGVARFDATALRESVRKPTSEVFKDFRSLTRSLFESRLPKSIKTSEVSLSRKPHSPSFNSKTTCSFFPA